MRDSEQRHFALMRHLRENGFSSEPPIGLGEEARYAEHRRLTVSFCAGWEEAQKWEASEAERNAIANQAMQGLLAGEASGDTFNNCDDRAENSYEMADAMIKARK